MRRPMVRRPDGHDTCLMGYMQVRYIGHTLTYYLLRFLEFLSFLFFFKELKGGCEGYIFLNSLTVSKDLKVVCTPRSLKSRSGTDDHGPRDPPWLLGKKNTLVTLRSPVESIKKEPP